MSLDKFTETTLVMPNYINDTVDTDEIIIGGTCTHVFKLPFIYTEIVKKARVIYRQALKTVLTIDVNDKMVHICASNSIIYVYLPKVYTELFNATLLDTECQLEIITKNNETLYDNPHKIKVLSPLDNTSHNVKAVEDVVVNGESVVEAGVASIAVPTAVSALENDLHFIDIKDYSNYCLFTLTDSDMNELILSHCKIINNNLLDMPLGIENTEESRLSISIGLHDYQVRFTKNADDNYLGHLVIKIENNIYELLISLINIDNELKAVIRCASIC